MDVEQAALSVAISVVHTDYPKYRTLPTQTGRHMRSVRKMLSQPKFQRRPYTFLQFLVLLRPNEMTRWTTKRLKSEHIFKRRRCIEPLPVCRISCTYIHQDKVTIVFIICMPVKRCTLLLYTKLAELESDGDSGQAPPNFDVLRTVREVDQTESSVTYLTSL